MKKFLFTLCTMALAAMPLWSQDIVVDDDSLYKEALASDFDFSMTTYIRNNGSEDVTIKWERVIEQIPNGWTTNFCDKNLCYLATVSSKEFELYANGDNGILKPVFIPDGRPGMCIYRIKLTSQTPNVPFVGEVVYVAVATGVSSSVEVLSAKDVALYPNPATEELTVAVADARFKGSWTVTTATGQLVLTRPDAPATGQLDLSLLPSGVYFLNIRTQDGQSVATEKFFIQ